MRTLTSPLKRISYKKSHYTRVSNLLLMKAVSYDHLGNTKSVRTSERI